VILGSLFYQVSINHVKFSKLKERIALINGTISGRILMKGVVVFSPISFGSSRWVLPELLLDSGMPLLKP
jgi:hypothetical protein